MVERILLSTGLVDRSESFRESVQPLVRDAAAQAMSVNALTASLRDAYGRAYRRADMLEDLRRYRSGGATFDAMSRYFDFRHSIARAGVVAFAVSLLLPALITAATHNDPGVLVADANELRANALTVGEFSLPNKVAPDQRVRRAIVRPEPAPAPATADASGPGVPITASWYGPGFFENRLPCWQWLQANGLPIQFLPDTWGVAHRTLPCGTLLVLTHGANTITAPVVDRGPYIADREIDMSPRIKAALGCTDLCTVLMQIR